MTSTPVLTALDFTKKYILECDASRTDVGAMLMKDKHPISFESQKLKPNEQTNSTYDKEMLEIMHALVK